MQGRLAGNGVKMVRKCGGDAGVQQQKRLIIRANI